MKRAGVQVVNTSLLKGKDKKKKTPSYRKTAILCFCMCFFFFPLPSLSFLVLRVSKRAPFLYLSVKKKKKKKLLFFSTSAPNAKNPFLALGLSSMLISIFFFLTRPSLCFFFFRYLLRKLVFPYVSPSPMHRTKKKKNNNNRLSVMLFNYVNLGSGKKKCLLCSQ